MRRDSERYGINRCGSLLCMSECGTILIYGIVHTKLEPYNYDNFGCVMHPIEARCHVMSSCVVYYLYLISPPMHARVGSNMCYTRARIVAMHDETHSNTHGSSSLHHHHHYLDLDLGGARADTQVHARARMLPPVSIPGFLLTQQMAMSDTAQYDAVCC